MKCRDPGPQVPAMAVRRSVSNPSAWAAKAPASSCRIGTQSLMLLRMHAAMSLRLAPPLLLVGELSHRGLSEYTHAITTLAIARAGTTDVTARGALGAAEGRLRACANVHRALRPPANSRPCDLGRYLEKVCAALSNA